MATILIVDDEEPVRELLALVLEDAGHRTLHAIHGSQALQLMQKERPDLVITDLMMPVMGGMALCQWLKREPGMRDIPVIMMSAAGERATRGAGADAFIDKPFVLDEMEALVRRWLRSVTPGRPSQASS